jgi:sugar phosphate isomerase/epimerase
MKNIGVVSVSFRECTPEQIIKAVKEAGLSCIEWGSDVHAPQNNPEALQEIVRLQNEYGISCSSYGTYYRLGVNTLDELKAYIDAAKLLGADILRVWCGVKAPQNYSEEEKENFFVECRDAARIAEENGVILCMECHHGTFTDNKEGMKELMNNIDSESFLMYWQPNQYVSEDKNLEYAQEVKPYCRAIHVFNWEGTNKFPMSQAEELWKKYLGILNDTDILLLEFMPDDRLKSLKIEASTLRKITEEIKEDE